MVAKLHLSTLRAQRRELKRRIALFEGALEHQGQDGLPLGDVAGALGRAREELAIVEQLIVERGGRDARPRRVRRGVAE
jgi:hypothetical protein